jgi:cell filamentation protein
MARYDADDVYCIPGTAVLKNKAGITNQDLLDEYEGDFTAIRLLELAQNPVEGADVPPVSVALGFGVRG